MLLWTFRKPRPHLDEVRAVRLQHRIWFLLLAAAMAAGSASAEDVIPFSRTSVYVPTRDGTSLALDIYRPAAGEDAESPAPVLLTMTPYQRARRGIDGRAIPDATAEYFARHGYVVAIGDVRGKGASFGSRGAPSDQTETNDIYDVIEWLAGQPWSNGKIGMQGCSYMGSTTMAGLRSGAPHLEAVAVGSTQFDMMTSFTEGGAARTRKLADEVAGIDADMANAVPVDEDVDGAMLRSTRADKEKNLLTSEIWRSVPFRDSVSPMTGDRYWITSSVYAHLEEVGKNGAHIYMYGSWNDPFGNETVNAWLSLSNPKMLLMSRGAHCQTPDFDRDAEIVRFFDRWLKGVHNGIDREPRVRYYVERGRFGHEWQTAPDWPLTAMNRRFVLGISGDVGTLGDTAGEAGQLTVTPPADILPITDFSVVRAYVDPLSVTFTSSPLMSEQLLAGTPIVHVTVSAPADDYVVHAYLEHVNIFRSPEVISRGKLLASRRKLGDAPYETGGVPYPTQLEAHALPVGSGEPVALTFGLSPIARRLSPGDRLRLAVTLRAAADAPLLPLTVYFGGEHTGWVDVPFATDSKEP